ncbi:hypothetical protein [[Mycobacterium] zoologicum]|nr:hypothetical protein [Mycolicibacter sp. MYC101]MEB3063518.1 hypothetical protein [Mycolicibacter sp. MYC101]
MLIIADVLFLAICEAAARMFLDGDQKWTPESPAAIVGPAAYRTFEI